MYLKAIEIQGFKSFPEKTRLLFDKKIVAIVGPNGSGKSNISDAVLWVLGEQRTRTLRGTRMEDVIFGGTEKRSALGFAQVSLFIDNSSRFFDYDTDEIVLSRKYYRSGESEYYINRESVRLKDLNSFLMDTGLGRDGYSNIGQGRIADIIADRNADRREVFEEAAGISRFRYRKDEAENQLKKTEENLLRINDKIDELELQVGPLREQAETAKKYLLLRDDLRVKEVSLWMNNLDKIHERSGSVLADYERISRDLGKAKKDLEALYASSSSIYERIRQKETDADQLRSELSVIQSRIAEHEAASAGLESDLRNNEEKIKQFDLDIESQEKRSQEILCSINESRGRADWLDDAVKEQNKLLDSNSNVINGCRMKLANRESIFASLTAESVAAESERINIENRIAILSEMENEFEGYNKAVKEVLRASERGTLKGIRGPVADLISAEEEYSLAIETALGGASQFLVTDGQNDAKSAIEFLKRNDAGRATFLPLDKIRSNEPDTPDISDTGFIDIAYNLVSFEPEYSHIAADLLGKVLITETLADAIRLSNSLGNKFKAVSLDGQVINPGGSMTGGSSSKITGLISRKTELKRLKTELSSFEDNQTILKQRMNKASEEINNIKCLLENALEERGGISNRISAFESERTAVLASINQMTLIRDSLSSDSEQRKKAIDSVCSEIGQIREKLAAENEHIVSLRREADILSSKIEETGKARLDLENKHSAAHADSQKKSGEIIDLERNLAKIEQKKAAAESEEKQIIDKLWDMYGLNHSQASSLRQPVESMQRLIRDISSLKSSISELGTPNIGAIDEFERVNNRYTFLTAQRDDVLNAKTELVGVIAELTGQMKEIFLEKFGEIDREFKKVFSDLFSGGKAELILEDEENVLESRIDISVQPPGKNLSTISLLSGGEMAFVAIALYFAILKVRPTPFCIMDEIDAALDETNVERFATYLSSMASDTQFLVITHRRGTMEAADMLYGVTMQEKGVSLVLPLDIDEAQIIAED